MRAVNEPKQVWVQVDAMGTPVAVQRRGWPKPVAVARVQDRWKLEDEWWRERPISRFYHALLLEDGALVVAYYDLEKEVWYEAGVHLRRLEPEPDPNDPADPEPTS
jgi:hypothetical protein